MIDAPSVSIVPARTADPAEAAGLVERDGAAILTGWGGDEAAARAVAGALWGDRVLAIADPAAVIEGGEKDRSSVGTDEILGLHTDGFGYGDQLCDVMALVCVRQGDAGGASFLVDGYALLDRLDPEVRSFLHDTPVDLTEAGMRPALSPVALRLPSGRVAVRRTPFMNPDPGAAPEEQARQERLLEVWREATRPLSHHATRFVAGPGDVICVDNYRVLHGRDPFAGERFMWRVWAWTTASNGVPYGLLHSDTRYAATDGVDAVVKSRPPSALA